MKRLLLIAPLAAALFLGAYLAVPPELIPVLRRVATTAAALSAGLACLAAAAGFQRGDHLRRAWLANAGSFLSNAVIDALSPSGGGAVSTTVAVVSVVMVASSNGLGVYSLWTFANAYRVAGLEFPGSRAQRYLAAAVALALSAVCAGLPFVHAVGDVWRGEGEAEGLVFAISSAGDMLIFALLAPIFLTAVALRGGLLVWPWAFFLASNTSWLVLDGQYAVADLIQHQPAPAGWVNVWLIVASAFTVAAALAQRRILAGHDAGADPPG